MGFLLLLIGLGTPLSTALGYWLPGTYALSLSQASLGVFILVFYSRKQQLGRAVGGLLLWALFLIPVTVAFVAALPDLSAEKIVKGAAYWEEMSLWIREGIGAETRPGTHILNQLRDLALISGASFLTGGAAGLWGGAVLMGKMNFYVGKLLLGAADPWTTALYAWQPYALCRVAGYVMVGAAAAQPVLGQISGFKPTRKALLFLVLGLALVFMDIVLKALLQPAWRESTEAGHGPVTNYSGYAATRRAGEYRVRIFTRDLVIEGTIVTMKEKPRLSDTLNDGRLFINLTMFETFPKGTWFASLGAGTPAVGMEKGAYLAVGKTQIEALHVVDPDIDPEKA